MSKMHSNDNIVNDAHMMSANSPYQPTTEPQQEAGPVLDLRSCLHQVQIWLVLGSFKILYVFYI